MSELEDLIEQRNKINARIKEIKIQTKNVGNVKLDLERYPTGLPDEWYIAVECQHFGNYPKKRWRSIVRGHSKRECFDKLDIVIENLNKLRDIWKKNCEGCVHYGEDLHGANCRFCRDKEYFEKKEET